MEGKDLKGEKAGNREGVEGKIRVAEERLGNRRAEGGGSEEWEYRQRVGEKGGI